MVYAMRAHPQSPKMLLVKEEPFIMDTLHNVHHGNNVRYKQVYI